MTYNVLNIIIHLFKTVLSSVDSAIVQCVNCCHTSIQTVLSGVDSAIVQCVNCCHTSIQNSAF